MTQPRIARKLRQRRAPWYYATIMLLGVLGSSTLVATRAEPVEAASWALNLSIGCIVIGDDCIILAPEDVEDSCADNKVFATRAHLQAIHNGSSAFQQRHCEIAEFWACSDCTD